MNALIIPKDIAPYDIDVKVYITKNTLDKESWLLFYEYLGYKVYFICSLSTKRNYIRPSFIFGKYYISKYTEEL